MAGGNNPFNPSPGGRRPTFRGIFQRDVTQGVERVRKWPKPRGRAKTAAEKARQDAFKWANQATKYMAPQILADITKAVRGTPLMPRDMLIAQLYGRLTMFVLNDGRHLWPKEAVMEVSKALDILSAVEGYTLRRGATAWGGVPWPEILTPAETLDSFGAGEGQVLRKEGGLWVPYTIPANNPVRAPARYSRTTTIADVTGDGTKYPIPYNQADIAQTYASLNTATGLITINESGVYSVNATSTFSDGAVPDWGILFLQVNLADQWITGLEFTDEPWVRLSMNWTGALTAGQTVRIVAQIGGSTKTSDLRGGYLENALLLTKLA